MANKLDQQYLDLLHAINEHGVVKKDRTGTGTKSIFGYTIRHNMKDGFPLLTTKKMAWKSIVTELLWFLRGDTNIKYLVDNGCNIWNGDAYKRYEREYERGNAPGETLLVQRVDGKSTKRKLSIEKFIAMIQHDDEFANKWGELGPIYGKQWRKWNNVRFRDIQRVNQHPTQIMGIENPFEEEGKWVRGYEDQIANLINELKTNPDSRRLMVSAWNVGELDQMVLPPCHYGFQVYTRELSLEERWRFYYKKDLDINRKHGEWDSFEQSAQKNLDNLNVPKRAISLMWNQRSVDTFLGLPFNIASYGLLLEIIARAVNMVPDELIGNLGDTHLYLNHENAAEEQLGRYYSPEERADLLKKAMGEEQYNQAVSELMPFGGGMSEYYAYYEIPTRTREPFDLPRLIIPKTDAFWKGFEVSQFGHLDPTDFIIENYQSHSAIKAPLSN